MVVVTGPLDGVFDNRTRSAIKGYQASRGLPDNGYLDRQTVVALVQDTNRQDPEDPQEGRVVIDGAQVIRGVLDTLGVNDRRQARSRYGQKRPK